MKLPGITAIVAAATTVSAQSPSTPTVEALVERVAAYLLTYEPELSTLVADESYDQRAKSQGAPNSRRILDSTVSFMRLPGGAAWLGLREVRRVDGRTVAHGETVQALLSAPGEDVQQRAVEVALASAAHNLGSARTINMPTLPLEFLHPRNMGRLTFRLGARETLRGVRTIRLEFEERGTPTIIRGASDGRWVIARGTAWVEPASGAIWRADVFYRDFLPWVPYRNFLPSVPTWRAEEASIAVNFGRDPALGLLVPQEMREVFGAPQGRGQGTARYSNYRRFTTSARIVPQQP
jgi:hypothetical protein